MKTLFVLLGLLIASTPTVSADSPAKDLMGKEIDPEVVTVYVYRPKKWGAMLQQFFLEMTDLEGTVILKNKTYYIHTTDLDGPFDFNGEVNDYPKDFEIFTELGSVYYVRCSVDDSEVAPRPKFDLVDEKTAKSEMKKLKMAEMIPLELKHIKALK